MRISILFFIPIAAFAFNSGGWCETIYKWRDDNGHIRYSNISPPSSSEFEITVPPKPSEEKGAPETAQIRKEPVDDDARRILREGVLKRIGERKSSISEIEKLLLGRPGDAPLMKSLMLKRQYLRDDLEALRSFDR